MTNLPVLRSQVTESFCAICPKPGNCCKDFYFSMTFWKDEGLSKAQEKLSKSHPFTVDRWAAQTWKNEEGREYARVYCSCSKLQEDGRCSIYNNRPDACRTYEPASDRLCVFSSVSQISFWDKE